MENKISSLAEKLASAQAAYKPVKANSLHPATQTYYATYADLVAATREALTSQGIACYTRFETQDTNMMLTMALTDGKESITSSIALPTKDHMINDSMLEFYQRKLYESITGVVVDGATTQEDIQVRIDDDEDLTYEKITEEQAQVIAGEIGSSQHIATSLFKQFGVRKFSELPKKHYQSILRRVRENKRFEG